ncbi:FAD-dependent oxidoreductase [Pseudonocardia sp. CA-107938]|uniref:FAD-dependent oxidoreductase n=1 Tax=Pseudonocardia sp. CA-107938 TaxID=3240021 RepID=UPI003D8ECFED
MFHTGGFDQVVDVAVLGLGNAGAVAAVTAHDRGAQVLVLEKQDAATHRPNSRYAAGFFLVPTDVAGACRYLAASYAVNGEVVDPELIATWARETARNPEWLGAHGGEYAVLDLHGEHDTLPDHGAVTVYRARPGRQPDGYTGCPLHGLLRWLVADRGIEVRHGARATALLTDATGAVVGVQVDAADGPSRIGVRRGVVLAVGGFEADDALKTQYLPATPVHFYGTRHNTGDGITMGLDVGAALWHMNVWPGHFVARFPGDGYGGGTAIDLWGSGRFGPDPAVRPPGAVFVDGGGRRFLPEPGRQHAATLHLLAMDAGRLTRPRIPTWWIFDDARMARAPLVPTYSGPAGPVGDYAWSSDNRAELARGWIHSGGSVAELAGACGLDPDALVATVERYNALCAAGHDVDHGRDPATLTPLVGDRFYAVALWPGGSHTVGGPRRDAAARVVSARGGPVAHLYSAGELGSIHGLLYPAGGASLAECLAFGRIAGESVAADRTGVR